MKILINVYIFKKKYKYKIFKYNKKRYHKWRKLIFGKIYRIPKKRHKRCKIERQLGWLERLYQNDVFFKFFTKWNIKKLIF